MKKWTVMLIPHDRGNSRTFTLTSGHSLGLIALVAALIFTSTCLLEWNRTMRAENQRLRDQKWYLEVQNGARQAPEEETAERSRDSREGDERLRAEYESSLAAIAAELADLYDMEAKARDITGLAPRKTNAVERLSEGGGGKGGPPEAYVNDPGMEVAHAVRPAHVIYGVARPSADLLLQEIRLRTRSFRELVQDLEVERDRVARIPAIWPLAGGVGRKSSTFGYRRDPIDGRIRQHNGTDICSRTGTRILATAKGVVKKSEYDRYFGHMVEIDHGNGMSTLYAHLSKRLVKPGQTVERGATIGALGSTGRSTGPHLHYEVHIGRKPVNPEKYLTE